MENSKYNINEIIIRERDVGYLDPGIDDLLRKLNRVKGLMTTSTCTGRVTLIEGKWPWVRGDEGSRILFKSHIGIKVSDIEKIMSLPYCNVWIKVSGPILHIRTQSLECSQRLLQIAREVGFKHSGIISVGEKGYYTVELMSGAQFTAPIRVDCVNLVNIYSSKVLQEIVSLVNSVIEENKKRLISLIDAVTEKISSCS